MYLSINQSINLAIYLCAHPHTHILNKYSTYICYTYICYIYIYRLYIWLVVSMFLFFQPYLGWLVETTPARQGKLSIDEFSSVARMVVIGMRRWKRYRKVGILPWFTIKHEHRDETIVIPKILLCWGDEWTTQTGHLLDFQRVTMETETHFFLKRIDRFW